MKRMFGFSSVLLDCLVCANEFAIEPVKKIATMNVAKIVKTEFVIFVFINNFLLSIARIPRLGQEPKKYAPYRGEIISYHAFRGIRLRAYSTDSLG